MRNLIRTTIAAMILASSAQAGVDEVLEDVILPDFIAFAETASSLSRAADANCTAPALIGPLNGVFDTWMPVADLHIGPNQHGGLSIAFWPDTRGFTPKTLNQLISAEDPVINDPAKVAEMSIAARGIFALERLIADPDFSDYDEGSYTCSLVRALADDLDRQATALADAWRDDFAKTLRNAGAEGNATYMTADEATRAIYTQIVTSLEYTADTRLGRPLGEITRPRPTRAETWRLGRSLANVRAVAASMTDMAEALAGNEIPATRAALDRVIAAADKIEDPSFQDIEDPSARFKVEVLQQSVKSLREAIVVEVGNPMGMTQGFNSGDGD